MRGEKINVQTRIIRSTQAANEGKTQGARENCGSDVKNADEPFKHEGKTDLVHWDLLTNEKEERRKGNKANDKDRKCKTKHHA